MIQRAFKLLNVLIFLIGFLAIGYAVEKPIADAKAYHVEPFKKVYVYGHVDIIYTPSDTTSVQVASGPQIEVHQKGDAIYLGSLSKMMDHTRTTIVIESPQVQLISLRGDSTFRATAPLRQKTLQLLTRGTSRIELTAHVTTLYVSQYHHSHVHTKGHASWSRMSLNNHASLTAWNLHSDKCFIHAKDESTATICSKGSLQAETEGHAKVHYKGDPLIKKKERGYSGVKPLQSI